jgi:hypothetical protein
VPADEDEAANCGTDDARRRSTRASCAPAVFDVDGDCRVTSAGRAQVALRLLDLSRDGVIGPRDIAILLANWGRPDHDVTGDGTVAAQDVAAVLAGWGGEGQVRSGWPLPSKAARWPSDQRFDEGTLLGRYDSMKRGAHRQAGPRRSRHKNRRIIENHFVVFSAWGKTLRSLRRPDPRFTLD